MPRCRRRRRRTTALRRSSALRVEQDGVGNQLWLELHLVHLELLRHRHRVRPVEARATELFCGAAADGSHQAWNGEVSKAVGADVGADLLHSSAGRDQLLGRADVDAHEAWKAHRRAGDADRKSTRLNSSHGYISYAVFCLKKKKKK